MPQNVRMWEVTPQNTLTEITSSEINLEERLEDWLESDISMLDPDLLVIGRQVTTDFGGTIDLLCVDSTGALVVVELKKGQTPRDVTAQALDYASWVKDLSFERIVDIASGYSKIGSSLDKAFPAKFEGKPLPDTLNLSHRSLIVAESMDSSTERIVQYLSDLNVPINVATVQHFKTGHGREVLAQVFLVEPEVATSKGQSTSKGRSQYVTTAQMEVLANEKGVGELYRELDRGASHFMRTTSFGKERRGFQVKIGRSWLSVFVAELDESDSERGLEFRLNGARPMNHFLLNSEQLDKILPELREDLPASLWRNVTDKEREDWLGYRGYFRTIAEVGKFLDGLRAAAQ